MREQVGLPITVGVARTKFLAKVASGVAKPDGLLIVPPAVELAFLHPLPVERLWGVGKVTGRKLRERGLTTVGEVADAERDDAGGDARPRIRPASARARPQPRPAAGQSAAGDGGRSARSVRWGAAEDRPRSSTTALIALVDRVTRRLRAARRVCRTVVLRMRFDDFSRATRSHTLLEPTAQHAHDPEDRDRAAEGVDADDRAARAAR